jgi:hypothetical protein
VQSIRLPREVVTGKTGLCIELSVLYSSILAAAGMDPVIFLIPGHAFPGFKMNGNYYALEATGIGGEGMGSRMTPEQAFKRGMEEFIKASNAGDDRYTLLDVRDAMSKGASSMELKDDPYLRQKVDEITQSWDAIGQVANNQPADNTNNGNDNNGNNNVDNNQNNQANQDNNQNNNDNRDQQNPPGGYNSFDGIVHFSYPADWRIAPKNPQAMAQLKYMISNNDNSAYVEVYKFDGVNDIQQVANALKQYLQQYGADLTYKVVGKTSSGFTILNGQTTYNGGAINWMAAFKTSANGMVGISAGANDATGTKYQSTVTAIVNSLK